MKILAGVKRETVEKGWPRVRFNDRVLSAEDLSRCRRFAERNVSLDSVFISVLLSFIVTRSASLTSLD